MQRWRQCTGNAWQSSFRSGIPFIILTARAAAGNRNGTPMPHAAMAALEALADPARAAGMAEYHKVPRRYLGVAVPQIEPLVAAWRAELDLPGRVALARGLWDSNVHEARLAAAKLLTQARIRPDGAVWELFLSWVPDFDAWALADHACKVGERRVMADLARLDTVAGWTASPHLWTRRAALVVTLPLARLNHPRPDERAARDRVLGWAAACAGDRDWFIQKAVAWWLRDHSRHDAATVRAFLDGPGRALKPWAQREAGRHLPPHSP
jgi:3-methyladenine DNA glycosylase AlkD